MFLNETTVTWIFNRGVAVLITVPIHSRREIFPLLMGEVYPDSVQPEGGVLHGGTR